MEAKIRPILTALLGPSKPIPRQTVPTPNEPRNSSKSPPQRRRGAESFLLKHPTVGIAGRLVFRLLNPVEPYFFHRFGERKNRRPLRFIPVSLCVSASPRLFELPVLG